MFGGTGGAVFPPAQFIKEGLYVVSYLYPSKNVFVFFRGFLFGVTGGVFCPAALFIKEVFYGVQSGDQTDADRP